MKTTMRQSLKHYSIIGLFIAACVSGVALTAWDRGLNLADGPNPPVLAFRKALCLADGLTLGVCFTSFGIYLTGYRLEGDKQAKALLSLVQGSFGLYSMVVGTFLCLWDIKVITAMQFFTYLVSSLSNWNAVRAFFREP